MEVLHMCWKKTDGSFKIALETEDQVEEEFPDEFVDISKIDFDQLACEIIDQYESERLESGRKELVKGMEYVLSKYNDPNDR